MSQVTLLIIPTLLSLQGTTPAKTILNIYNPPPKTSPPQPPAQRRFTDNMISFPATIVPKLFGDKPFWVPHAYFNLCPFVRGPEIDPVWSAGCAPLPYSDMQNFNPQNTQDLMTRLQALQAQQEQAQKQEENQPSWWEQYRPSGPLDFGMAQMYGPVQQQEMYSYGVDGGETASSRGSSIRGRGYPGNWAAGGGTGFWPFWG